MRNQSLQLSFKNRTPLSSQINPDPVFAPEPNLARCASKSWRSSFEIAYHALSLVSDLLYFYLLAAHLVCPVLLLINLESAPFAPPTI